MVKQNKKDIRSVVSLRLNHSEQELLNELSNREGLSKSNYLRSLLNNKSRVFTLHKSEVEFLRKSFAGLSLMGSNLNQIAYQLNLDAQHDGVTFDEKQSDELLHLKHEIVEQINILQSRIGDLINSKSD